MTLDNLITGSYGSTDHEFALHPLDINRAAQSIVKANEDGVGLKGFIEKHKTYLTSKVVILIILQNRLNGLKKSNIILKMIKL